MSDDILMSVSEAARYAGVTRQAVYQAFKAAGIRFDSKITDVGKAGPRQVLAVWKSEVDTFRANGFLKPGNKRRVKGSKTRRKVVV